MNILVLNGSPHENGNTKKMTAAFEEGAVIAGHRVDVVDVCKKGLQAVWLANTVIQKEKAFVCNRMICRKYMDY